jgi:hypothetical protein
VTTWANYRVALVGLRVKPAKKDEKGPDGLGGFLSASVLVFLCPELYLYVPMRARAYGHVQRHNPSSR